MSGREFFTRRYERMGWKYETVEPRQAIRVNLMNTGKATDVVARLRSLGIQLEKIPFLQNGHWICKSKFSIGATTEYLLGLYSIQEAAAQIPATLFTETEDKTVLDACAAPGGKTVQLADLMRNTGAIIALDIKTQRLAALSNQLERCRVKNAIVYLLDARNASQLNLDFDCVLLDLPCSGNFIMDRNWFNRRTIADVERNAALQREMLTEAVRVVRDGGEIVYSTCSLEPEEDEFNIDWAIKNLDLHVEEVNCYGREGLTEVFDKRLDSSIKNCRRIWPEQTQGFFVCKLRRSGEYD
jgi:NOL1/NOP2/sun family putative RNA methylase